jgi:peptide methionine sulfoxide reductase MsrB
MLSPDKTYFKVCIESSTPKSITLELIKESEKGIQVSLVDKPILYRGEDKFWLPKAGFKKFKELSEVLQIKDWFYKSMDDKAKVNLTMKF